MRIRAGPCRGGGLVAVPWGRGWPIPLFKIIKIFLKKLRRPPFAGNRWEWVMLPRSCANAFAQLRSPARARMLFASAHMRAQSQPPRACDTRTPTHLRVSACTRVCIVLCAGVAFELACRVGPACRYGHVHAHAYGVLARVCPRV